MSTEPFWGAGHVLTLIVFIHEYLLSTCYVPGTDGEKQVWSLLPGSCSWHRSLPGASPQERVSGQERVGDCMVTTLHRPDFRGQRDTAGQRPLPGGARAVIADPPSPLAVSAQRWSGDSHGGWGDPGGTCVLTIQVTKRGTWGEVTAAQPSEKGKVAGSSRAGLGSQDPWLCRGWRLVPGTPLPGPCWASPPTSKRRG